MLCEITKRQSIWIWRKLEDAHTYQSKIGEESITDFFILALKKVQKGNNYEVNSFTRHQESKNGADWEIWLTGNSRKWLGLRVQAKVISLDGTEFKQLHYKNGIQTTKLIDDALKHNAIPLYCLYSYWDKNNNFVKVNSPCAKRADYSIRPFGASILHAKQVQKSANSKLQSLAPHLIPLHCLFCDCKNNQSEDLPTRTHKFLTSENLFDVDIGSISLLDKPPQYVYLMSNLIQDGERDLYFDENEKDEALARVTVIKEINNEPQEQRG
jgi:hypothetical protein